MEELVSLIVGIGIVIGIVAWIIGLIIEYWVEIVSFILFIIVGATYLAIFYFTLVKLRENFKRRYDIKDFFKKAGITLVASLGAMIVVLLLWYWLEGLLDAQRKPSERSKIREYTKQIVEDKKKVETPKKTETSKKVEVPKPPKGWVWVSVPIANGKSIMYEVMKDSVTEDFMLGNGSKKYATNITFENADKVCMDKKSRLMKSFVFQASLSQLNHPEQSIRRELLLPYDEEEDEIYYQKDKTVEVEGEKILLFDWNKKTYKPASMLFKSDTTTFRCMRVKP